MDVLACQGDIATEAADVLVSPSSTTLGMSGGAAAAIRQAGDESLPEFAAEPAPVEVGEVVFTAAPGLFADYIAHAAAKPATGSATPESVRAAVNAVLTTAADKQCRSVVFPLIGSGVGGLKHEQSADLILDELAKVEGLEEVRLITRDHQEYRRLAARIDEFRTRT